MCLWSPSCDNAPEVADPDEDSTVASGSITSELLCSFSRNLHETCIWAADSGDFIGLDHLPPDSLDVGWKQLRLLVLEARTDDYVHLLENQTSPATCKRMCSALPNCTYFAYNKVLNRCVTLGALEGVNQLRQNCAYVKSQTAGVLSVAEEANTKEMLSNFDLYMLEDAPFNLYDVCAQHVDNSSDSSSGGDGGGGCTPEACVCMDGFSAGPTDSHCIQDAPSLSVGSGMECSQAVVSGPLPTAMESQSAGSFVAAVSAAYEGCIVSWDCNLNGLHDADEVRCVVEHGTCFPAKSRNALARCDTILDLALQVFIHYACAVCVFSRCTAS
jgi:hypothetical protein